MFIRRLTNVTKHEGKTENQIKAIAIECGLYKKRNKAGYTATLVACGWAGAVLEKVTRASGQDAGAVCSKSSKTPKK